MADMEFMGMASRRLLRREAVGVVGAITPWNFPLYLNLSKLGPGPRRRLHGRPEAGAGHALVARRRSGG